MSLNTRLIMGLLILRKSQSPHKQKAPSHPSKALGAYTNPLRATALYQPGTVASYAACNQYAPPL